MTKKNNPAAPAAFVMMDGHKVNVADIATVTLDKVIADIVVATKREHGAQIRLAAKLNDLMDFDWFDIDNGEVSNAAAMLKPHKDAVYKGLKDAGHANPSVAWGRLRGYGRNLRAGLAPNGKTLADGSPLPEGEGAGDGEGANPARRSDTLFMVEELTRIYKRAFKAPEGEAKVRATLPHIIAALKCMGVDERTIATDKSK